MKRKKNIFQEEEHHFQRKHRRGLAPETSTAHSTPGFFPPTLTQETESPVVQIEVMWAA